VPVAVRAAVEQQDLGSTGAQRGQGVEERLGEELGRACVVAVEEDEHPPAMARRNHEDLVQVAMRQPAVQREVDESVAARRVVGRRVAAPDDCGDDDGYRQDVAKAADWLRQERRKVLGDWVAFCLGCGAAHRWFEEFETDMPDTCTQCGGELLRRCKGCGAPFSSLAVVDCEGCGAPVRVNELFGSKIRRA
jgi:hypothetical protein